MRGAVLALALVATSCSESGAALSLRDAEVFGSHRRAVFVLRDGVAEVPSSPAFGNHRERLGRLRTWAGERTGLRQPDLDRVRTAALPSSWSDADARAWANELDAEWVVLRLAPVASPQDIEPPTPSYVDAQGYRGSAFGIGIDDVDPNAGTGVAIHEVEYGWRASHEDLVDVDLHPEPGQTVAADAIASGLAPEHGTATVGMLVAPHNGYGIDGMVPSVSLHTYPEWTEEGGLRRAEAVAAAVSNAEPGDIVMLQMQAQEQGTGQLAPAEIEPDVWMLTRMAADAGIVVIAAGGNGAFDLDGPDAVAYREMGDSGAILVGAASPDDRSPLPFSSHGRRIDLQGWGASVFTLGYGDFERFADDDDQAYTDSFEGTSSALPMVVSASAALIEGFVGAEGAPPDPLDVRRVLVGTGRAQADGVHVGPLPDVPEALAWVGAREFVAPSVEISTPALDEEVLIDADASLMLDVEVDVEDDSPLYRVELEVDGALLPTFDEAPPYAFEVELDEGEHVVRAQAVDVWGNAAWSQPRTVTATVEDKPGGSSSGQFGTSGDQGDSSGSAAADEGGGDSGCAVAAGSPRGSRPMAILFFATVLLWRRKSTPNTVT